MDKLIELIARLEFLMANQALASRKVLSLQQAAQYLDLSEAMAYKLTSERSIPHSRPSGKKIFFNRRDLDAWALSNRVKTREEIELEVSNRSGKWKANRS